MRVGIACLHCQTEFELEKSEVAHRYRRNKFKGGLFCSKRCAADHLRTRSIVDVTCSWCGGKFQKLLKVYTQAIRLSKSGNLYCSKECVADASKISPFKYYITSIRCMRNGRMTARAIMKLRDVDLSVDFLEQLFENQNGRCALTEIGMIPPDSTQGWKCSNLRNASLDRIHSDKPYVQSNVQFVCMGINKLKGTFSDEDVSTFLEEVRL